MLIGGFQKMTVLDFPGKIACILFTYGCNLKCPFCHNASLVIDDIEEFSQEEIFKYLEKRKGVLDGVCVSGGEPFLQPDIMEFLQKLKNTGLAVKIDTNGTSPEKLRYAVENGLVDYVAMDIKNSKEKYPLTTGIQDIDIGKIEESVKFLLDSDIDYEFRTTVVREYHTEQDMVCIGEWIKGAKNYFLQSFTDSGNLIGENLSAHSSDTMRDFERIVRPFVQNIGVRGVN